MGILVFPGDTAWDGRSEVWYIYQKLSDKWEWVQQMKPNHRRSDIEIIGDMLRLGENGAGKTAIMYNVNMSYSQIQKYLGFLLSEGYFVKSRTGNSLVTYKATNDGLNLLQNINNCMQILDKTLSGISN